MSKKNKFLIFSLVILVVCGGILLVNMLDKDNNEFFLEKVNSIDKIILANMSHEVTLTDEESQLLKQVIINKFKEGKYQREKMDDLNIPIGVIAFLFDKSMFIGYFPETKQLFFKSIWFIPNNLNNDELGEHIFKTKDMLLTINDEIEKMMKKYNLNLE